MHAISHQDISHPNSANRLRLVLHISRNPDSRTVEQLLSRLTDRDPTVLAAVYRGLAGLNKQTVVPALLPLLDSNDAKQVKASLALLRYFAPIDHETLQAHITRGQAMAPCLELLSYHEISARSRQLAQSGLHSPDRDICLAAMACVKRWAANELAPLLLPVLAKHADLAETAIKTLARLAYVPALDRLSELLAHSQLGPAADQAIKTIIKQMSPEEQLAKIAASSGSLLLYLFHARPLKPDKKTAEKLHQAINQALNGHSEVIIGQALACLMKSGPLPYVPNLLSLIQNNGRGGLLKKQLTEILLNAGAQKIIGRHLNHTGMVSLVAACLRNHPDARAQRAMSDITVWLGQHKTGFNMIKQLLKNGNKQQRGHAALAMGRLKLKQGTAYLARALYLDPQLKVAWAAANALYTLRCVQSVKILASGLRHQRLAIRCICLHYLAQGGYLWPWLRQLASDSHPCIRHHLLRAIACHKRFDWYELVADALRNDREDKIRFFCMELDINWNTAGCHYRLMRAILSGQRQESGRAIKLLQKTARGVEVLQLLLLHSNADKKIAALSCLPGGSEKIAFNLLRDNNPVIRSEAARALSRWRV